MEKYIMVATNEQIERSKARRKVIEALEYNPMCYNCKSFGKSCKGSTNKSQAINNALDQEKSGVIPRYSFRDYKTGEKLTPPGWLVFSTFADGCGVVYRRSDGKMIVTTGFQGDFVVI